MKRGILTVLLTVSLCNLFSSGIARASLTNVTILDTFSSVARAAEEGGIYVHRGHRTTPPDADLPFSRAHPNDQNQEGE